MFLGLLEQLLVLLGTVQSAQEDSLIITTTKGKIKGLTLASPNNKKVDAWYGIPFAKPPVGNLRFRHPEQVDPWDDIRDAKELPNSCIQVRDTFFPGFEGAEMWNFNTNGSEDCLYLSVHAPKPRPTSAPVLVWIYGGGYYSGTSTLEVYDPRVLVAEENVVFVAMQYRVANLGFLFMDEKDAPGNGGLYDQMMALQWVKENIKEFGGDPERITIFGESAGASSVSLHLLSPLSRNLFSQGIMQSSSALVPWGLLPKEESRVRGLKLAELVGCPHDKNEINAAIECLRGINASVLVNQEWLTSSFGVAEFPFTPVVDGTFITQDPRQSLDSQDYKKTNILIGSNKDEANYFLIYYLPDIFVNSEDIDVDRSDFISNVPKLNKNLNKAGEEAIIFEYSNWLNPDDPVSNREAIDRMVGDYAFTCPTLDFAHAYAATGNNVYAYYFSEVTSVSPWPKWSGAMHGDEIAFIFGHPLDRSKNYDYQEIDLSKRMMRYWANFARTGDPNIYDNLWPLYSPGKQEVFELNAEQSRIIGGYNVRKCAFWRKYLPKLLSLTIENSIKVVGSLSDPQ